MSYAHKLGRGIVFSIGAISLFAVVLLLIDMIRLMELIKPMPSGQSYIEPLSRLIWSALLAVVATVFSIISGIWIVRGFYLQRSFKRTIDRLSIAFYFPHLIVALYVLAVANFLYQLIDFYHPLFGFLEILLAYWVKEVPFVVFYLTVTYTSLDLQSRRLIQGFGGSKWQQFYHVEWVAIQGQVAEIFLILFAFILTAYEIPALIGSSVYPLLGPTIIEYYYSIDLSERFIMDVILLAVTSMFVLLTISLFAWTSRLRHLNGKGSRTI